MRILGKTFGGEIVSTYFIFVKVRLNQNSNLIYIFYVLYII